MQEQSFQKRPQPSGKHKIIADALWRAFPEAESEHQLSKLASEALLREGGEVITDRGVRKWLAGDALPRAKNMAALEILIGAEAAMDLLFGKDSR